ncbi:myo-inositol 2-dehydrogenase [Cryptococcus wingfieldii CBS 7118]|uniref:Myo-inositol 2-dehydrogenase n=1 Tax=Cryptococcus wingfieldii CBS 7118 TaxID=1295528 RepID=A0A1E3HJN8_9TREE|nr:myo-inositol 2-dehydrogenase [Cryptococcus wingfieldii CBS 7118]ODN76345.1 myo-inositol 2-dehydrogenase [Cryptococcus wingfieldii CBS 7118]
MALSQKLKYAVLGVGRMGQRHALNLAHRTPRAELVAIADPKPASLHWATDSLSTSVGLYTDFEQCLAESGADAVLIASETKLHAPMTIAALHAGKHVLVEKPISIDLQTSRDVVEETKKFPDLKVMVGFSRRFDESYREAYKMINTGKLGKPHLIKSATNDQYDPSGFFAASTLTAAYDIDCARWLLSTSSIPNPLKQVTRVFASGHNIRHPELVKDNDVDNAVGFVEFENGGILMLHLSRTAMHGHDCFAEVFGTDGKVIINGNPQLNRVEIRDVHGVRSESTPTYYERFKDAFVLEVNEFTDAVLDNKPLPVNSLDALEAAKIATALTHSFRSGQPVYFSDEGEPLLV